MIDFYFPQSVHEQAHLAYMRHTGVSADKLRDYCLADIAFFIEVTFAYVEGTPPPIMKKDR